MATIPLDLDGYTDLPPGLIANVVTFFEMAQPPNAAAFVLPPDCRVRRVVPPDVDAYLALYRRIGHDWLWFSRAIMPRSRLAEMLNRPTTEIYFLERGEEAIGLVELSRGEDPGEVEIDMFGVVREATGTGIARGLMSSTLEIAWSGDTRRVWLHTCSFDHPAAVRFYRKMGFTPFKFAIEVSPDPRLDGHVAITAGPHVAIIPPR